MPHKLMLSVTNTQMHRRRRGSPASTCNFSSNDYLGLSQDLRVQQAFQESFAALPTGSGGSVVISGYHRQHQQLETAFCEALNVEDAVILSSGYVANLGLMMMAANAKINVFLDKAAHASFYDGLKLSDAVYQRFPHQTIPQAQDGLIVTESVFSMSGYLTPLEKLTMPMFVDEAHAFGLYGKEGLGRVQQLGLTEKEVPLRVIPLGKAFAAQGAIVAGRADWIDAYIQSARGYIYSTSISPALAAAYAKVLEILRAAEEERAQLFENIRYFRQLISSSRLAWTDSVTPIQQLKLGNITQALTLSEGLLAEGIFCQAIRPPTVPLRDTGLRVVLNARHTKAEMQRLVVYIDQLSTNYL